MELAQQNVEWLVLVLSNFYLDQFHFFAEKHRLLRLIQESLQATDA